MYADVEEDLFSFFFKLRKYVSLLSKPLSIVPPIESQEKGKYRAGKNYAENTLCTYGEKELGQTLLSRFSSGFGRTLITRKRSYGSTLVENPLARLPPGPGNFRERSVAINPPLARGGVHLQSFSSTSIYPSPCTSILHNSRSKV